MSRNENKEQLLRQAGKAAKEGRLDEAGALVEQVLEVDSSDLKALSLLGFVRFFQKRYSESEIINRQVLDIDPYYVYALSGLGSCLARQGRLDEARESFEKAIALKPTWSEPYWDLAVAFKDHGRTEVALAVLAIGMNAVPDARQRFSKLIAKITRLSGV
ncbi:MAG: tetratricopeptide repeat protein [Deltaproteobacteria bacterium]|nr:tetratricopeptide repeat protein [Deltaproteobacteria bacterium]